MSSRERNYGDTVRCDYVIDIRVRANSGRRESLLVDTRLCCDYPVLLHEGGA